MSLTLYNTRTRAKEAFVPLNPDRVTMYVCGPTVYNYIHIGNARPAVVFDTLYRVLKTLYPEVVYARNITDIDDKIMQAAKDNGESIAAVSERYTQAYLEDMVSLNTLSPDMTPKATENVDAMQAMIGELIERGHAYEAEGHVLFAVQSMADYGKLSNRSLDDMLDGARVEVAPYKKYAGDFVLWKPSTASEPGWDSPWGYGRPGWHLECSAMIKAHLGDQIDIHGGGRDLIFPHHENERAQSCCSQDGEEFVRYWVHNGYLNIDGEKMSKSLGNFRTVRDLLGQYRGEVLRFALLSAQYRSELDFSRELLAQAKASLDSLYTALKDTADVEPVYGAVEEQPAYKALLDDLNTPIAIAELHQLAKALNKAEPAAKPALKGALVHCASLMGLCQESPQAWFKESVGAASISAEEIEALIAERQQAKLDKAYARADEIREELKAKGVLLEDSRDGTSWRRE
ncbi:cysteine--tRNA ligase [Litorivivens sp.]|uniref:cysteine--tRNA ligase n=1 Tax=Litorivivens sp. TaxID=2020868 RepID=UPI003561D2C7